MSMEKRKYKFIKIIHKSNDSTHQNPLGDMNKTFSQPKTIVKELPKNKKKKSIKDSYTSKAFNRIWSSQNIYESDRNWDFLHKPTRNNLYSTFTKMFRAPSVKENRFEIYQLMKKEKNRKIDYLKNIYNTIMINESKLYRKKLYLSGFKSNNNYSAKGKEELIHRYNINDMNDIIEKNKREKLYSSKNMKSSFILKNKRKVISSYSNSLLKYKNTSKKKEEENESSVLFYDNKNKKLSQTSSTNKTNYRSNLKSTRYLDNSKSNDLNNTSHKSFYAPNLSTSKFKTQLKLRRKEYKNIYYQLYKKENKLKKSKIFLYFNQDNEKQNTFQLHKDIELSRMSFKLNEIVFDYNKDIFTNLTELAKIISKFKICKIFQVIRLEELSRQNVTSLEKRIDLLQKTIKKINKISIIYFQEMQDYMNFLKKKRLNLNKDLESENNKRLNLYFELEKLVVNNILTQRKLEQYLLIKNFLIQVKYHLIKQPNHFNKILKEVSHKYELAKLISELKIQLENQTIVKFMESIPDFKENNNKLQDNNLSLTTSRLLLKSNSNKNISRRQFTPKRNIKKYSQNSPTKSKFYNGKENTNKNNNQNTEEEIIDYLTQKNKLVFTNPDEFFYHLSNFEDKNLRLIQEYNYKQKYIKQLKSEYEDISKYNFIEEVENDIIKKTDLLKILKEQNSTLIERYNYFNKINNNLLDSNSKKKIKDVKLGAIVDINVLKSKAYDQIIQNYNKKGLLFLEKLLDIIKNFFKVKYKEFEINRGYEILGKNVLNRILKLNHKILKNTSITSINEYTMRLLNLYENICEFIKYRDKIYNSIEENRYIIRSKKEEIQLQRKIENSKYLKQYEEEKREAGIKKIMQKETNINVLFRKIMDENIVLKNKIKKNDNLIEYKKYKQNLKEKEFNFYVKFE